MARNRSLLAGKFWRPNSVDLVKEHQRGKGWGEGEIGGFRAWKLERSMGTKIDHMKWYHFRVLSWHSEGKNKQTLRGNRSAGERKMGKRVSEEINYEYIFNQTKRHEETTFFSIQIQKLLMVVLTCC